MGNMSKGGSGQETSEEQDELVQLALMFYTMNQYMRLRDKRVTDVWAMVEADDPVVSCVAAGELTEQRLEPGTYFIIKVDGLPGNPEWTGLNAFPIIGGQMGGH